MPQELWPHQKREVEEHTKERSRFLAWSPRTGKTRTIIEEAKIWGVPTIVVLPKSAALTWMDELGQHGLSYVNLADGSVSHRRKLLSSRSASFYLVNYDALAPLVDDLIEAVHPRAAVFDEAHKLKTSRAKRTKASARLANQSDTLYVRCLTGTPTPRDYRDLYAQCFVLDGGKTFGISKRAFEQRYCKIEWVGGMYPKLLGYRNLPELLRKWKRIATCVTEEEAFGAQHPPLEYIRHVHLEGRAEQAYKQLKRGVVWNVPIAHKLAQMSAAQRIASGVYEDSEHDLKIRMALAETEAAVDAGQKVVIFYKFVREGEEMEKALRNAGIPCARIGGDTSLEDRNQKVKSFHASTVLVLCIQQNTAGEGIAIHGDLGIFLSPDFDWATHYQARQRLFVPGKQVSYVYIHALNTIDHYIHAVLRRKGNMQKELLSATKEEVFGAEGP